MSAIPSPDDRIAALEKLIHSGSSFDEAIEKLVPDRAAPAALMRPAAAIGLFNKELFDAVIGPAAADVRFDAFIATSGVERAGPDNGSYRLADHVALEQLRAWTATSRGRKALASFFSTVHRYVEAHPDACTDTFQRLRFQLVASPAQGLEEFQRRFDEADRAFDLAECHALIQVLRNLDTFSCGGAAAELKLLTPEQRERAEQLGPYVAARGRFMEDYTKSANYLKRAELELRLDAFLDIPDQWLFPVHGPGGRGKTMFQRWLVARRCLPDRIAVAKADFDQLNTAKLAKFPWLVLLTLAEQLNRQIAGAPFSEFLSRYADYAAILLPPGKVPAGIDVEGLESDLGVNPWVASAIQDFALKLSTEQAVILLDTLEEPVLHFPGTLQAVIAMFRSMHEILAERGQLKLVLCGRYDLAERGYLTSDDPASIELTLFTMTEARGYLRNVRKVDPQLVDAIADKAQGNPFILSLIADLVASEEICDVAAITVLRPEYAYLIERVIKRIPEAQWAVRWVIRYGVVPRRLTPDFLEQVMQPHLRRETDRRGDYKDAVLAYSEEFPRKGSIQMGALWSALRSYADSIGWLQANESEVRFQPEVIHPMRELLQCESIYRELHEESARWFKQRARNEQAYGVAWGACQAEVFYHRLQLGRADLENWFHRCLLKPQASDPKARIALLEAAATLLPTPDAIPCNADGTALLAPSFVPWVHFELARAEVGLGWGMCPPVQQPHVVRKLLDSVRRFGAPAQAPTIALIEMALSVTDHDYDTALAQGRSIGVDLLGTLPDSEQYAYHLLTARSLAGLRDAATGSAYRAALSLADENGRPLWELMSEFSRELMRCGNVAEAVRTLRRTLLRSKAPPPEFVLHSAELLLDAGEVRHAENAARAASAEFSRVSWRGSAEQFRIGAVLMACALERGQVGAARQEFSAIAGWHDADARQAAQLAELEGLLNAASYDIGNACSLLAHA
ncbi:MAG: hypothetical protein JWR16_200, partial [Nevskia sp.]|nr:hypothetical protein [Nevskia sp.]